jgi:hypothetical protein
MAKPERSRSGFGALQRLQRKDFSSLGSRMSASNVFLHFLQRYS